MKTIKINFADFWKGFEVNWDFITPKLKNHFNVIIDRNNPDILFCSTLHSMSLAEQYKCPKILFVFESHPVTGYPGVEFTFSYAPHSEKNFYFPEWQIHTHVHPELIPKLLNRPKLDFTNAKFCSFVYSNPDGAERNELFHKLNEYKRVDSYGQLFRNNNALEDVFNGVEGRTKEDYFNEVPHKFTICYERDSLPGYCSEKLMNGFLSGSVPIYWGDPGVYEKFNPMAFINIDNLELDIKWIKELDNSHRFDYMIEAPIFTGTQKDQFLNNMANFETVLVDQVNKLI